MTRRSACLVKTARFSMLATAAVVSVALALASASAQQERSGRSDRTSGRDDSAQSRDQSSQRDQSGQLDQRRRFDDSQNVDRSGQTARTRDQQYQGQQGQGQTTDRYQRQPGSDRSRADQSRDQSGRVGTRQGQGTGDVAWLGVFLQDSQSGQEGAQIAQVYPAGPAARAGLRAGDLISQLDGQRIRSSSELISAIEEQQPGARAQLAVTRNNQQINLPVTLGSRESFTWRGQGEDQWSGQGGGYASSGQSSQYGGQSSQYGRGGQSGQEDYFANLPPFAMQLEHERRMYEQHQRIETEIAKLQDEVRQLRELIQQQRR